jgi:CBS domain-containing protein
VSQDFLQTVVRDIMTPGVLTISEDASLQHVYRAMVAHSVHAILVVGRTEGVPLGWVTARGLLGRLESDDTLMSARDAITEKATVIEPGATVREAVIALSQPGITHVLVCRHPKGTPEGVVSDLDVVALRSRPATAKI